MKWIFLSLLLMPFSSRAEWSVDVYGFSYHPTKSALNEENYGLGLRYDFGRSFLNVGGYNDSLDGTTIYAGGGYQLPIFGPISLSLGAVAMHQSAAELYYRENGTKRVVWRKERNILVPVSVLSFATNRVMTNFGYFPEISQYRLYETYFVFWTISL